MRRAYLLRLKIHPQQQVLEGRVVAEGVKCRINFVPEPTTFVFISAFSQRLQGLVFLANGR